MPPVLFFFKIVSTSYSSSPSIRSGGGYINEGPCLLVSVYRYSSTTWKTLWIFQLEGSFSQYDTGPRTLVILKGPSHSDAISPDCPSLRLFYDNYTKSPLFNRINVDFT